MLDSSGDALRRGLEVGRPLLIKPNVDEFAALVERKLAHAADIAAAAMEVSTRYQTIVVVSMGAEGVIAANRSELLHVYPPQRAIKNAVGSGDCTLAGITYGLTHGFSLAETIKYGVAAGTANALTIETGAFTRADFERVHAQVTLTKQQESTQNSKLKTQNSWPSR